MIERTYIDAYMRHFKVIKTISLPRIVYHIAFLVLFLIAGVAFSAWFTPWVQTASGTGFVTTLHPSDRVQNITALVSGRIKKWYVQEGDTVKKGDPLVEIIDNDVNLIDRLLGQRNALKYSHDATTIAAQTAKLNYDRQQNLFASGLVSKLDVEKAHITYKKYLSEQQKAYAKLKQSESKVSQQQAQLLTSSRDGVILSITAGDLSTSVKSGDNIAVLVPNKVAPAVSLYINGIDIALVNVGRKVRLQFEGWPSIQFSGWPSTAIGTFGGIVQSVDPTISENGRFRVLVTPDKNDAPWPDSRFLHYGARVKGWVLLEKVRLGYELWRQLNAFPPEFSAKPPENYPQKSSEKKKK
jgi:multidrug efflux pump subunit AcrA (membrane-fusion protein)